ncbi:MAG: nucleotide exchange factor GrpE [Mycoplasmataceae bacterium]|jgi:molecular chaperone GrpE|nr:nucleotide exchange factor GrpE [Mycoplasmataceae bacterium]
MPKHENKKEKVEIKENSEKEETNILNEQEISKSIDTINPKTKEQQELENLIQQVAALNEIIIAKDAHIAKLQNEINQINQDYVTKITEKTNEANTTLKAKIEELTNKANQELSMHKKYALEKQAINLIDIINQFAMALDYKPTDPNIVKYQSGFQMFLTMFKNLLTELGINEIVVNIGDEFNPEIMECIEFVHSNELTDNKVAKIITKGYKLYDRLIKPTSVNIVRKKS